MAPDVPSSPEIAEPEVIRLGTTLSELGRATMRPTVRSPGPTQGRLDLLCDALSVATERTVSPHAVPSYADLLASLHWGEIHFAWLPPMIALRAISRGSAIPLVAPERSGSSWYWTALFTREDSPITSLDMLKSARVAWVDQMSSAGYLVIRASLRAQGIELAKAFGAETFAGTHDAVALAVLDKVVDVGATFAHFDDSGRVRSAGWGKAPVRVLKYAGPIPSDILAASVHLPSDIAHEIADAFVGEGHSAVKHAARDLVDATGFIRADRQHLSHLEELLAYLEIPASIPPPRG
jgi:phosphonate transport system substrate-binding protein